MAFSDGDFDFTILFDRSTKLPAAVRTRDDDWIYGDVNFDLVFGDWRSVDGIKIPSSKHIRSIIPTLASSNSGK